MKNITENIYCLVNGFFVVALLISIFFSREPLGLSLRLCIPWLLMINYIIMVWFKKWPGES